MVDSFFFWRWGFCFDLGGGAGLFVNGVNSRSGIKMWGGWGVLEDLVLGGYECGRIAHGVINDRQVGS